MIPALEKVAIFRLNYPEVATTICRLLQSNLVLLIPDDDDNHHPPQRQRTRRSETVDKWKPLKFAALGHGSHVPHYISSSSQPLTLL